MEPLNSSVDGMNWVKLRLMIDGLKPTTFFMWSYSVLFLAGLFTVQDGFSPLGGGSCVIGPSSTGIWLFIGPVISAVGAAIFSLFHTACRLSNDRWGDWFTSSFGLGVIAVHATWAIVVAGYVLLIMVLSGYSALFS